MDDTLCETDDAYKGDIYIVDKDFTWTFVKLMNIDGVFLFHKEMLVGIQA